LSDVERLPRKAAQDLGVAGTLVFAGLPSFKFVARRPFLIVRMGLVDIGKHIEILRGGAE